MDYVMDVRTENFNDLGRIMYIMRSKYALVETIAQNALCYIAEMEGDINDFLDNYDLAEEFYDSGFADYFGFNEQGEYSDDEDIMEDIENA